MNHQTSNNRLPIQVQGSFSSFSVGEVQSFDVIFANYIKPSELVVSITNPLVGSLDKQVDFVDSSNSNTSKCKVSFKAPIVGIYTIDVAIPSLNAQNGVQFQAKAYDLSKVFINGSSGKCLVNESYEFAVDASEAGEGQLEIAVNEGEIPNQVQVLDNGKCIVNFMPEDAVPHVVDIKFNGHNVNGCPFVVEVSRRNELPTANTNGDHPKQQVNNSRVYGPVTLTREDRIIVNSRATFSIENLKLDTNFDERDLMVFDPENQSVSYKIIENVSHAQYRFEFVPSVVGDYTVELRPKSALLSKLPAQVIEKFPFSLKVFDYNKVIVSDVTDGVVGHPIYFFIDASQAGSGNLEIRVSTKDRNVPNVPQSEANAKIRVSFTPTEAVEHSIDVKFNGFPVPNNPFLVNVAQYPQARLPISSRDLLKYVAIDELTSFYVDCIGNRDSKSTLTADSLSAQSCQILVVKPDFISTKLSSVELLKPAEKGDKIAQFKVSFKPTKIGPYKLFITVNNELLPSSPILCNVYNINEVRVTFDESLTSSVAQKTVGKLTEPVSFTVDASRAGEGTLALAVVSGVSRSPVQTDVKVSEKGHGLYNLTFVPTEFATHSIDMSFNDRVVPNSPFVVYIRDKGGNLSSDTNRDAVAPVMATDKTEKLIEKDQKRLVKDLEGLNISKTSSKQQPKSGSKSKTSAMTKEEGLLQSIVVHGISLKRSPVNSTGAFIIETNRMAHANDFEILITDSSNNLVDVQCYLQQDGNLLAEWTPRRVGAHKIEVLYKELQVPGSPFVTEAFDPSGVIIEPLKSTTFLTDDAIEIRINRKDAGSADLDVSLTDASGKDLPVDMKPATDGFTERVTFSLKTSGLYKLSITLGGYEVPKSPMTFTIRDRIGPVQVAGAGLKCAEVNRNAQFSVDAMADGELKIRIENGNREIVPKVERRGQTYIIKYKPTEVGYATISLYWNGLHLENSPYSVPINDLTKILLMLGGGSDESINQLSLRYEPRVSKQIIVNTSKCGPGELKAEAYCRANSNLKFPVPVERKSKSSGVHEISFVCPPEQSQLAKELKPKDFSIEATYLLRFYYNNLTIPETIASVKLSPGKSSDANPPAETNNNNNTAKPNFYSKVSNGSSEIDCPIVALRGHGLVEAKCGEEAEFTIDGTAACPGKPEVRFTGASEDIQVKLEQTSSRIYKATYVISLAGSYTLNVLWDGKQVAGCPIVVQVSGGCDSSKVVCTADSIKGAVLGDEIRTFIDTRKAGPGELTALCTGPQKVAFCELLDRGDGTFILYIKPQEAGKQTLTVKYGGQHIPKSPFVIKVSGKPDPTKVRVYGPGVEHGVLSLYQSRFVCDTRGAGAGQLTVRIRGPKGAFRMETQRESQRDRTILCKYDPTELGDYRIEIKWSGHHVPGSPFSVMIFDTQEELNRFLMSQRHLQQSGSHAAAAAAAGKMLHHHPQVPFQPTMVEYGQYPNIQKQPPFRL